MNFNNIINIHDIMDCNGLKVGDHIARIIDLEKIINGATDRAGKTGKAHTADRTNKTGLSRSVTEDSIEGQITHHGIVVSVNPVRVIHFNSDTGDYNKNTAKIIETDLATFMCDQKYVFVIEHENPLNVDESVCFAKKCLTKGYGRYNLLKNNCEHFVFDCKTGRPLSKQASAGSAGMRFEDMTKLYKYDVMSLIV